VSKLAVVVDDSAAMRRIQVRALEGMGWTVQIASNGDEALSLLRSMPHCDLLLTDWHMPGLDGLELVKVLRADARFASLPILMVTSDAVLESVQKALEAGVNDFLMKPFTPEALAERVAGVMGG
jgi:two-component system chemotaxis response regulator CheY